MLRVEIYVKDGMPLDGFGRIGKSVQAAMACLNNELIDREVQFTEPEQVKVHLIKASCFDVGLPDFHFILRNLPSGKNARTQIGACRLFWRYLCSNLTDSDVGFLNARKCEIEYSSENGNGQCYEDGQEA